jgi:hypothetical protein
MRTPAAFFASQIIGSASGAPWSFLSENCRSRVFGSIAMVRPVVGGEVLIY